MVESKKHSPPCWRLRRSCRHLACQHAAPWAAPPPPPPSGPPCPCQQTHAACPAPAAASLPLKEPVGRTAGHPPPHSPGLILPHSDQSPPLWSQTPPCAPCCCPWSPPSHPRPRCGCRPCCPGQCRPRWRRCCGRGACRLGFLEGDKVGEVEPTMRRDWPHPHRHTSRRECRAHATASFCM